MSSFILFSLKKKKRKKEKKSECIPAIATDTKS